MKTAFVISCLVLSSALVSAQATYTASRSGDLQIGIMGAIASPDYGTNMFSGVGVYATFDVRQHLGLELSYHRLSGRDPILFEHTYEGGLRYSRHVGRLAPYVKVLYGRGVFNFAGTDPTTGKEVRVANLAFNMVSFGGGLDFNLTRNFNIRAIDYEYQMWPEFPPRGLDPHVVSFGFAYHFNGKQR